MDIIYFVIVIVLFPHFSFFWCYGKTVFYDCGISRVLLLIFLLYYDECIGLPSKFDAGCVSERLT